MQVRHVKYCSTLSKLLLPVSFIASTNVSHVRLSSFPTSAGGMFGRLSFSPASLMGPNVKQQHVSLLRTMFAKFSPAGRVQERPREREWRAGSHGRRLFAARRTVQ